MCGSVRDNGGADRWAAGRLGEGAADDELKDAEAVDGVDVLVAVSVGKVEAGGARGEAADVAEDAEGVDGLDEAVAVGVAGDGAG